MLGIVIHVVVNANALKDLREHHGKVLPGHCSGHRSCVPLSDFEFEDVAYLNLCL